MLRMHMHVHVPALNRAGEIRTRDPLLERAVCAYAYARTSKLELVARARTPR